MENTEQTQRNDAGCRRANSYFSNILKLYNIKKVVQSEKWSIYFNNSDGRKIKFDYGFALKNLETSLKDRQILYEVMLDNPSGKFVQTLPTKNRIRHLKDNEEKITFYFDARNELAWQEANAKVSKTISSSIIFDKVPEMVCPKLKCDIRAFRDNDHLRASFIADNGDFLIELFEDIEK